MEETRRPGLDRRKKRTDVSADRRKVEERRAVLKDYKNVIAFMKKFPIFKGFTEKQYIELLRICSKKTFPPDHYLYKEGDESDGLFILTKGELNVLSGKNSQITRITPKGLAGEIGLFTGKRRITSMVSTSESTVIRIHKIELFRLFKNDSIFCIRFLLNIIDYLAKRLEVYNDLIEEMREKKPYLIL